MPRRFAILNTALTVRPRSLRTEVQPVGQQRVKGLGIEAPCLWCYVSTSPSSSPVDTSAKSYASIGLHQYSCKANRHRLTGVVRASCLNDTSAERGAKHHQTVSASRARRNTKRRNMAHRMANHRQGIWPSPRANWPMAHPLPVRPRPVWPDIHPGTLEWSRLADGTKKRCSGPKQCATIMTPSAGA